MSLPNKHEVSAEKRANIRLEMEKVISPESRAQIVAIVTEGAGGLTKIVIRRKIGARDVGGEG